MDKKHLALCKRRLPQVIIERLGVKIECMVTELIRTYRTESCDSIHGLSKTFPVKSRNGLTLTITSLRMTSCAMPKTEPVGLTFVQLTDDDNDDDDNDDDDDDNDDDDDDDARNSNIIEQIHIMCFTVVGS